MADTTHKVKKDKKQPQLRIKLKSYDLKVLESSLQKIVALLKKSEAKISWPIPLPKKRKVYSVQRSTFVYEDSHEQFERFTYSRLIDVVESGTKTMEYLQNLVIPVWVSVDIRVF